MKNVDLNILLVEDCEIDQMFFKKAIESISMKTKLVILNDGEELMKYLGKEIDFKPHILFLDIQLPKKSGLECLKEIRLNSKWSELCIVIYSNSKNDIDVEKAFVNGANIFLNKPNEIDKLVEAVKRVFSINWQYLTSSMNRDTFIMNI
ncbi:response regulator [Belliella sp. DSM 111904]|uniref:Response regulator n=1 Tax=Belliella filtrata TaxID=2923435 RepID=A0ABS9V2F4_9BACT|nr:response regulator [Belliella filtrata]MCH7410596.1 response regulator [Belliella filtrata]